jgi:hypothetical protein
MDSESREFTRVFDARMAKEIGLNESIVLSQLCYWISLNKKAGRNFIDGKYWTYNTFEQWHEQFPWWSVPTIKRIFASLEKGGYIITGRYNEKNYDQTRWYTVVPEKLLPYVDFPSYQNDTIESANLIRPIPKNNDKEYLQEISGKVRSAAQSTQTTSDRPTYDRVETMDPEKKITRQKCVELFGEDATNDAKKIVDDYIDRLYPKYRCEDHPKVSHRARYAYVYRILRCTAELLQPDLSPVAEALLCAVKRENGYDPTIYLVTRPRVLGMWLVESEELPYEAVSWTYYDINSDVDPDIFDVDESDAEAFRDGYQPME